MEKEKTWVDWLISGALVVLEGIRKVDSYDEEDEEGED